MRTTIDSIKRVFIAILAILELCAGIIILMYLNNFPIEYRLIFMFIGTVLMYLGIKLMPIKIPFSMNWKTVFDLFEVVFMAFMCVLLLIQFWLLIFD